MYEFSVVEKLLPPPILKKLQPVVKDDKTDSSIYDEFAANAVSVMSVEYGSNVEGIKQQDWVKTAFVNTLSYLVSSTISGLSQELLDKFDRDYKYSCSLLKKNSNTQTNVKSGVYQIGGMYEN